MAKTTLLLAAFVATINAIAAPAPEITPAPLIRRQIESRPDPPYDVLGSPDQYIITDLGPDTSIISYDGSSYHVCHFTLVVGHSYGLTILSVVH